MNDAEPIEGGTARELASEPLLSCHSLLMASLVGAGEGGRLAVELGRHPVTADGLRPAYRPLRLGLDALPRVRRLAEEALGRLQGVLVAGDELRLLARDGGLGAAVSCADGQVPWFSLVLEDGSGVVTMPAREAGVLAKLVRDAERQLSGDGLAPLDKGAAH
jgi:hypothetical protein